MRAWAEINLDNLEYNIKKIRELSNGRELMAIIKADAYGMGAVSIARELSKIGINIFGVSSLDEGIELRNKGIESDILILAGIFDEELKEAENRDLQVTITDKAQIEYIKKNNLSLKIHLKIDTGMGRVGFTVEEGLEAVEKCRRNGIEVVGIYSHLSVSDESDSHSIEYTKNQLQKFEIFEKVEDIKYLHILNSGGIIKFSDTSYGNLVRAGVMMYGFYGEGKIEELKPVFTLKSRVLFLKKLGEDMDISYGRIGKGKKGDMIATVSIGYADGVRRELSNKGTVEILGVECKIIGRVCMDMLMVKIPREIEDKIKVGEEVIVLGKDIYSKSLIIGCSIYELFTGLSRRVTRVYIKNKKSYFINSLIGD